MSQIKVRGRGQDIFQKCLNFALVNKIQKFASPPGGKTFTLGRSSHKIDTFQPLFGQIYLILDLFLPFFQISTLRAHFLGGEEIQKSKSGGGKDLEKFELYLPVSYF